GPAAVVPGRRGPSAELRGRLRQVDDRAHEGRGRVGRPDQDRPGPKAPRPTADPERGGSQRTVQGSGQPLLCQHGTAPLVPRPAGRAAPGRDQCVWVRRDQLPCGAGGIPPRLPRRLPTRLSSAPGRTLLLVPFYPCRPDPGPARTAAPTGGRSTGRFAPT